MKMKNVKTSLMASLLFLIPAMSTAGDYGKFYQNLPVNISEPQLPSIPDYTVSISDFGAVGDGCTLNTEAFSKAISQLSKKGGGHLIVPAGVYLTGLISLKDNIDLHLERNAMILCSPDKSDFLKKNKETGELASKASPAISASKRKNISITGEGIIDGNGEWWRAVKRGKVSDVEWKVFKDMGGTEADGGSLWYPFNLKHFANVADSYKAQEKIRTHLINLTDCENVLIKAKLSKVPHCPKALHKCYHRRRNSALPLERTKWRWH